MGIIMHTLETNPEVTLQTNVVEPPCAVLPGNQLSSASSREMKRENK